MTTTLLTDDQLWELVESLWRTMLGWTATRDFSDTRGCEARELSASVQIDGAFRGTVLFLLTEEFALRTAARMLAVPEGTVAAADADDAVGELCNILGGGIKNLVPAPSSLSLPIVRRGPFDASAGKIYRAAGLRFTCSGEPLELRILEDARYAASAHH